jgi:hypothetical protein
MRKDMSKVIVERPRHGSAVRRRLGRTSPLEDEEGEPLRARAPRTNRLAKTKYLNENLSPLKRYLESQVNRPWNKVFSEISTHLKPSSTVQQHVRDHLEDFVAFRTRMQDGKVMASNLRRGRECALEDDHRRFYVHPKTGILKRNPNWNSWSAKHKAKQQAAVDARAHRLRELGPMLQAHLLNDGAWWEVKIAKLGHEVHLVPNGRGGMEQRWSPVHHVDVIASTTLTDLPMVELYGRNDVYAVAKRQLSAAEKKKLGLP